MSRQDNYAHATTVHDLHLEFLSVQQGHAQKGSRIISLDLNDARTTVPDHFGAVHVKQRHTAIRQDPLFTAQPDQPQGGDPSCWGSNRDIPGFWPSEFPARNRQQRKLDRRAIEG